MTKQLDMFGSDAARDAGLDLVSENANADGWWDEACDCVRSLRDWTGTGEDLRLRLRRFIGDPHDEHAWGALTARAVKQGWLVRTGERRKMRTRKSHSRKTDVYRSS